ncbi:hypothetical protein [Methylocapsa aurea]|uniref:hypothetical protein n=1 Tax=Methylocapsa aurea TaxID=663610 RepID=UPI00056ACE97|nr:hypothetical protein [Methylocapsa aurea]
MSIYNGDARIGASLDGKRDAAVKTVVYLFDCPGGLVANAQVRNGEARLAADRGVHGRSMKCRLTRLNARRGRFETAHAICQLRPIPNPIWPLCRGPCVGRAPARRRVTTNRYGRLNGLDALRSFDPAPAALRLFALIQ